MATPEDAAPPEAAAAPSCPTRSDRAARQRLLQGGERRRADGAAATPTSAPAPWTPPAPAIADGGAGHAGAAAVRRARSDRHLAARLGAVPILRRRLGGIGDAASALRFARRSPGGGADPRLAAKARSGELSLRPARPKSISPFATEIDLRAALSALSADYQAPRAPSIAAPPPRRSRRRRRTGLLFPRAR